MRILEKWFYITCIGGTLAGGVMWLTTIDNKASASVEQNKQIQIKVDATASQFEEIRTRLTRIEDKLDK